MFTGVGSLWVESSTYGARVLVKTFTSYNHAIKSSTGGRMIEHLQTSGIHYPFQTLDTKVNLTGSSRGGYPYIENSVMFNGTSCIAFLKVLTASSAAITV